MQAECFLNIVIPAYKEPNILSSLQSLYNCDKPRNKVELIIVLNYPADDSPAIKTQTAETCALLTKFITQNEPAWINTYLIEAYDLPTKKAGVGLARKIGMDEAAWRFNQIDKDGIIVCFDADSLCQKNYLVSVEAAFLSNKKAVGASIYYEHPLQLEDGKLNTAIIQYELHLRYYIQALAYCGYPFAYHTIGSSMAVRSSVYQKQGGMNTRKAGEDFYFLHKLIPLGNFLNINNTKVIPSARESDRVPFGTGRAMQKQRSGEKSLNQTYNFESFEALRFFFEAITSHQPIDNIPAPIEAFLLNEQMLEELKKIKEQAKSPNHFTERFFQWFNGFKVLKCVHYLRDNYFPEKPLTHEVQKLFNAYPPLSGHKNVISLSAQLTALREYEQTL